VEDTLHLPATQEALMRLRDEFGLTQEDHLATIEQLLAVKVTDGRRGDLPAGFAGSKPPALRSAQ